jgi:beta-glucosidase
MSKDTFLRALLDRMTPEEKAGQLNLLTGAMDATGMKHSEGLAEKIRAGLCGAVINVYTQEATHALQELALQSPQRIPLMFGYDVIHGHRTIFPIPLGLSCSWNPDLLERCARHAAQEAAADGLHWVFSPMVDISHDARWGRVAEGSGEDPWLGSQLAAAMVRGYQGDNLSDPTSVVSCVKHFALYGAPLGGRDYQTVDMSRRTMEETYFPPYRAAVDAGARTVMTSFNDIDGTPASGNRWLLTDLLRKDWGFSGWIVTDYTAVTEMKHHGTAATDADAARQALTAGVDMDMVSEAFVNELPGLLESGAIHEHDLDAAVMRVLETKWDLGLFTDAYTRCDPPESTPAADLNRPLAREAARESVVLLKNDRGLLPLERHGNIAVIGPLADSARDLLGCWIAAGDETEAACVYQAIRAAAGDGERVIHAKGCEADCEDDTLLAEAVRAASHAEQVILVLGETWDRHGEAASLTNIRLPKCQRRLAKRILKIGKPCVFVTISGRPLELTSEAARFSTMLHAWAPGTEGGHALAEILFGDAAPVGKLTMGFPRSVGQLPMTYREKTTGRPFDADYAYSSKYLDCGNDALFPFGHGLTYGTVEIGAVKIDTPEMPAGSTLNVSVTLTNPGDQAVTDTVQLYLRDVVSSFTRPGKELRGYQRVTLAAGESRMITFPITDADLSFPGPDFQPLVEPGEFLVMIGTSSADLRVATFYRTGETV